VVSSPEKESLYMERKKASDFPQELLNLFDKYVHGDIDRRNFLDGAKKFAVGGLTVAGLLRVSAPTTRGRSKFLRTTNASRSNPRRYPRRKATEP
jgi:hypothetical protein